MMQSIPNSLLSPYAREEIETAYGSSVLSAADAYVSHHKEIAVYVNEDPHLIASFVDAGVVRCVQNTNPAYIDTGVVIANLQIPHVEVGFSLVVSGGSYNSLFGGWRNGYINTGIWINNYQVHSRWGFTNGTTYPDASAPVNTFHTIKALNNSFYFDNSLLYTFGNTINLNFTNTLFGTRNNTGAVETYGIFNITYLKIQDNTTIVREMYPFIRNGVHGMMDIANDTFYTNSASTGSIVVVEI